VHSRSSGCWIAWDRQYGKSGIVAVSNGRIGKSGYVEGYVPPRPDRTPTIAGFRFVTAQKVSRKNYDWAGLWVAEGNDQRTQIIGFNDTAHTVLANLPSVRGMASLLDLHGASHMTWIGKAAPASPSLGCASSGSPALWTRKMSGPVVGEEGNAGCILAAGVEPLPSCSARPGCSKG
jgi:hypothetical protein